MSGGWLGRTAIFLLLALVTAAPARADNPGHEWTRLTEADFTSTSPDGEIRIEQYSRKKEEDDLVYQFWSFDQRHQNGTLLNPGEDTDLAGYPAGFRFSRNSLWLVRMQKLGAGYHTLFLYRRTDDRFSTATPKPLGDMAWDFFFSQPIARKVKRTSKDIDRLNHKQAHLLQGMDDNYARLAKRWPDSRYIALSLSFDSQGEERPLPWITGWRCVFDTRTGQFSIPADFARHNAKAVEFPDRKDR